MEGQGGILGIIAKRMSWLGHRQSLVARNIANSDTPHFIPMDLKESSFRQALNKQTASVEAQRTHAAHISGARSGDGEAKSSKRPDIYEVSPSGNAVILEQELVKMNEIQAQHSLMVNLYRKNIQMMKLALGRGGGH